MQPTLRPDRKMLNAWQVDSRWKAGELTGRIWKVLVELQLTDPIRLKDPDGVRGGCLFLQVHSTLMARAARITRMVRESRACNIDRIFAQPPSIGVSVGENAVLVLKATKR
jgi:hypothetical protein